MYVPNHFNHEDASAALAFMQRFNFATLVSLVDNAPFASHLPFIIEERAGQIWLSVHMAKNNPQGQNLADQQSLTIFSEPHAYVSPSLYEKEQNVPTWNYIAIHAYGRARLIDDETASFRLLEKQIQTYEAAYAEQWQKLSEGYKNAMIKGIVSFEIPVEKLESKWKLSQNKSEKDQETVARHLENSQDTSERTIAAYMRQLQKP
ncbi:MAG: FMN-binding negative transcriptional regulator [Saprospiraceae bacterium]|nr:FMN-binding negative transcriptional regulator [Saprospiraceae bacterium]